MSAGWAYDIGLQMQDQPSFMPAALSSGVLENPSIPLEMRLGFFHRNASDSDRDAARAIGDITRLAPVAGRAARFASIMLMHQDWLKQARQALDSGESILITGPEAASMMTDAVMPDLRVGSRASWLATGTVMPTKQCPLHAGRRCRH
jgi:hypothetical protein